MEHLWRNTVLRREIRWPKIFYATTTSIAYPEHFLMRTRIMKTQNDADFFFYKLVPVPIFFFSRSSLFGDNKLFSFKHPMKDRCCIIIYRFWFRARRGLPQTRFLFCLRKFWQDIACITRQFLQIVFLRSGSSGSEEGGNAHKRQRNRSICCRCRRARKVALRGRNIPPVSRPSQQRRRGRASPHGFP